MTLERRVERLESAAPGADAGERFTLELWRAWHSGVLSDDELRARFPAVWSEMAEQRALARDAMELLDDLRDKT